MVIIRKDPLETILKNKKGENPGKGNTPPIKIHVENPRKGDPKSSISANFSNLNLMPTKSTTLQSVRVGDITKMVWFWRGLDVP